jgi:hypothetical protein
MFHLLRPLFLWTMDAPLLHTFARTPTPVLAQAQKFSFASFRRIHARRLNASSSEPPFHPHLAPKEQAAKPKSIGKDDWEQELLKEAATKEFPEFTDMPRTGRRQRKRKAFVPKAAKRLYSEEEDLGFMQEALVEAREAAKKGEVPVGAVLVHKNKIIARFHNL